VSVSGQVGRRLDNELGINRHEWAALGCLALVMLCVIVLLAKWLMGA